MNTTNCPPGKFSDQIYNYYEGFDTCDSEVAAYIGTMTVIILIRFLIFLQIALIWQKARRSDSGRQRMVGYSRFSIRRRLPIVPTLHFLSCLFLALHFALTYTNTVTARNGTTHFLMVLWVTPFFFIEALALRKLVYLGNRIIPWNGKMSGGDISKFDTLLRRLVIGMVFLFFSGWISMIIGCFTNPLIFDRISLASLFVHQVLFFSSLVYQYQRCIACITATVNAHVGASNSSLVTAKRRLQFQQLIMVFCGVATSSAMAYLAISLGAPFWAMELIFTIELVAYGLIAVSFTGVGKVDRQTTPTNPDNTTVVRQSRSPMPREVGSARPTDDTQWKTFSPTTVATVATFCEPQEAENDNSQWKPEETFAAYVTPDPEPQQQSSNERVSY